MKEAASSLNEASATLKETAQVINDGVSSGASVLNERLHGSSPRFNIPSYNPIISPVLNVDTTTFAIFGGGAALVKFLPSKLKAVGCVTVLGSGMLSGYHYRTLKHKERLAEIEAMYKLENSMHKVVSQAETSQNFIPCPVYLILF